MKKMIKFGSIRGNLVLYSLSIITLMTVLSLYSIIIMNRYKSQIDSMFENHIYISEIKDTISDIDEDLLGFLSSKSSARLNGYLIGIEKLDILIDNFYKTNAIKDDLMMKNIKNFVDQYKLDSDIAITFKRQRNVQEYHKHYEKSVKTLNFIYDYIRQMTERQININTITYSKMISHSKLLQMITFIIVIDLIIFSLLIVYLITSRMVKPFTKLYASADEISKGNYETQDVIIKSDDEFRLLAESFNNMKNNISDHIVDLKHQAETEVKLKDEQMKNLRMEYLLDNAKLSALQSQINPHFLFNTINAGVQLSVIERATRTGEFLESLSRLFRYNLQKMNGECTLEDEVGNIRDYYDLLKVRFRDRIQFQFDIDEKTLDLKMPPMVLQPIVENSYIHGLSSLEAGGTILISTELLADVAVLTIADTGVGISPTRLHSILAVDKSSEAVGIGIRNVKERLEIFYHQKDIFTMMSEAGKGVKTVIRIPRQ